MLQGENVPGSVVKLKELISENGEQARRPGQRAVRTGTRLGWCQGKQEKHEKRTKLNLTEPNPDVRVWRFTWSIQVYTCLYWDPSRAYSGEVDL